MAATSQRRIAADSNFAVDLAAGDDLALTCHEVLRELGWSVCLPPTVIDELVFLSEQGPPEEQELAGKALDSLDGWNIQTFSLSDVNSAIAESFGNRLIHAGLLPVTEWNDGVILGEAAVEGIPLLVTSDRHLLHIAADSLKRAFNEADLDFVLPVRPRDLSRILR